jgi:hypothetical protein
MFDSAVGAVPFVSITIERYMTKFAVEIEIFAEDAIKNIAASPIMALSDVVVEGNEGFVSVGDLIRFHA